MEWVHAYNQGGPDALAFRRTGGRRPLFAHSAKPSSARWSAPPSARRPPHPSKGLSAPRWTLRRLVHWVRERFGLRCCRETIRALLHRRKLSWKKAKKLLGRADPERRQAFIEQLKMFWPALNAIDISWSTWMRRTSTRTRISGTRPHTPEYWFADDARQLDVGHLQELQKPVPFSRTSFRR